LESKQQLNKLFSKENADIETSSDEYASRFVGEIGEYFLDVQKTITLGLLRTRPRVRVLDVGGGHAQIAVPLVHHGYRVTVVGSDDACGKRLEALLEEGSFEFHSCNILSLPFEDGAFDVVVAFRLLPHVTNWRKLISELCRVAGSDLILDYPDVMSFNFMSNVFFSAKKAIEGNTRPYRCFRRSVLLKEFDKHGFYQTGLKSEFFIPMVVHRAAGNSNFSKTLEFLSRALGLTRLFGSPVVLRVTRRSFGI
jgi:ubiquinone/menaquinone biosynthesis C-methylase UbiE